MTIKFIIASVLIVSLISGSIASIYYGHEWYVLNLFVHFQLQLLVLLLIIGLYLLSEKSLIFSGLAFGYCIYLILLIFPAEFNATSINDPKIFFQNALITNVNNDELITNITETDPHITAIVELSPELSDELNEIYDYQIADQGIGGNRCSIFSSVNYPQVKYDLTYPVCAIQTPEYQLIVIHPAPPLSDGLLQKQLKHFAELGSIINNFNQQGQQFILIGDFNSAPYPNYFKEHFGPYVQNNIYSWSPHRPWSIPIDHALANFDISVSIGKTLGSDHAGLLVDTQL
jgi:hypothetical protein